MQLRVTVADTMTESIFEKVFSKNVAAAQPLPGFRRMKGGLLLYLGNPYFVSISVQIELDEHAVGYVSVFCSCILHTWDFFMHESAYVVSLPEPHNHQCLKFHDEY